METELQDCPLTDQPLLELFRRWLVTWRAGGHGATDEEIAAASAELGEIEEQIWGCRATGAAGLAIKAYLLAHCELGDKIDETGAPGSLAGFSAGDYSSAGRLYDGHRWLRALMIDAAHFVPELVPLAAAITGAPMVIPPQLSHHGDD